MDTEFPARAEDQTFRMGILCRNCERRYGQPCLHYWSDKSKTYERECAIRLSTKTEENEELHAKLAKALEDNEKLEKKLTEAVKENEELQQKLIILEQDFLHESNLYSNTLHRVTESERREMNLNSELDKAHNKWVEEKKRSQDLLNEKNATDAKTQNLENEARYKDTKIIELERKVKDSEAVAKESESKYSNTMAELDNMREKHRKISAESESGQKSLEESNSRISELKSKLEALENRKLEEQVNLTTSDDQVPSKHESSIYCHYFNNFDACRFMEITGRQCRFLHRRSPKCRFGFACNRKKCMYVHDIPHWPLLPTPPPFPWQHPPPIWHSIPPPRTLQQFWQD